ncbi:hypothetical protein T265_02680 [Opisthorchis viverrini]|uniref:Uncharacterized protein n=1 Tax=Opisthorchis viverrini TaxID=6198 RepID=A0A074ZYD1_OPIVI|nr:hypothetical protein T265_02680 [Opisthorchis viverrini]KER31002.1 hypothetical protein T265_02680 [Opisthorchis viverrini]
MVLPDGAQLVAGGRKTFELACNCKLLARFEGIKLNPKNVDTRHKKELIEQEGEADHNINLVTPLTADFDPDAGSSRKVNSGVVCAFYCARRTCQLSGKYSTII